MGILLQPRRVTPIGQHISHPVRLCRTRPLGAEMGLYEPVKDAVRLGAEMQAIRQQLLEVAARAALWITQCRSRRVESRRLRDGRVHYRLVEVDQGDPRILGRDLPNGLGVCRADLGVPACRRMPAGQVKLCDADLIQGRRRDEEDIGAVCRDVGVADDPLQVGLVPVEGDMLVVCGQLDAGIVGAKQDELVKVSHGRTLTGNMEYLPREGTHQVLDLRDAWGRRRNDLRQNAEGIRSVVPRETAVDDVESADDL